MGSATPSTLKALLERLRTAQNQHDLDAFLACFAPDYRSEQAAHPDRAFGGREQVQKNWGTIFGSVLDFQSELLHSAAEGDTLWAEWRWYGTRTDGTRLDLRGVTLFGIQDDLIVWGRLYMEPVQASDARIDGQLRSITQGSQQ
jgi:ketosteroid isomerase-like protein